MSVCDTLELHQFVQHGGKIRQLLCKKNYFWFTPLSKILVARLVAFTAVYIDFSSDYWPQTKRAKKRCRPYFKIAYNCSRKEQKISFYELILVPPHFVCSGDGTGSNSGFKRLELLVYYAPVMSYCNTYLRL